MNRKLSLVPWTGLARNLSLAQSTGIDWSRSGGSSWREESKLSSVPRAGLAQLFRGLVSTWRIESLAWPSPQGSTGTGLAQLVEAWREKQLSLAPVHTWVDWSRLAYRKLDLVPIEGHLDS